MITGENPLKIIAEAAQRVGGFLRGLEVGPYEAIYDRLQKLESRALSLEARGAMNILSDLSSDRDRTIPEATEP